MGESESVYRPELSDKQKIDNSFPGNHQRLWNIDDEGVRVGRRTFYNEITSQEFETVTRELFTLDSLGLETPGISQIREKTDYHRDDTLHITQAKICGLK